MLIVFKLQKTRDKLKHPLQLLEAAPKLFMPARNPLFSNHSNPYCLFDFHFPLAPPRRAATADLPSAPAAAVRAGKASFAVGPRFRRWGMGPLEGPTFISDTASCMSLPYGQETPQRKHGGQGRVGELTNSCSLPHT